MFENVWEHFTRDCLVLRLHLIHGWDWWRDLSHHFTDGVHPQASLLPKQRHSHGKIVNTTGILYHTVSVPIARAPSRQCKLARMFWRCPGALHHIGRGWPQLTVRRNTNTYTYLYLKWTYQCPNNTATASSHRNGKTQPTVTQGLGCTKVALTLSFPYAIPLWSSIEQWDCDFVSRKSQLPRKS